MLHTLRYVAIAGLTASASLLSLPAASHDFSVGDIEIGHPWARLAPASAPVVGGYLTLTNAGSQPDTLIGGTTAAAERVEIHEMRIEDGVARMRPLPDGQEIGPGATVELEPGGIDLMFVNPERAFSEGERFEVRLAFAQAGDVTVEFIVQRGPADEARQGDEHGGHAP
ncbi:copper chaperone PCu(A)C [Neoaquamicrobium sediminum]|uniref:Copper chaperone PCu(A)C n=1 Tax=Neoaquamicrobium sediminum TaxID=1849104 RepID=A0ABV3WZ51_9HYPH